MFIIDSILSIGIPLLLSVSWYPVVIRVPVVRKSSMLFQLCMSIGIGHMVVILVLGFAGMAGTYIQSASIGLCVWYMLMFYWGFSDIKRLGFRGVLWLKINLPGLRRSPLRIGIVFLFFLMIFLYAIRPIADSDVVDSYLPFARSIILENRIPERNYYDDRAFIAPPPGGSILFAFYYTLSGDIRSEPFRFLMVPFFWGFLALSYCFFRRYLSKSLSEAGLFILSAVPLLEDQIFLAGLYPDLMFAFTSSMVFYCFLAISDLSEKPLFSLEKDKSRSAYIVYSLFAGIFLSMGMLIKFQAIILYSVVLSVWLVSVSRGILRYCMALVILWPLLLIHVFHIEPFPIRQDILYYLSLLLPVLTLYWYIGSFGKEVKGFHLWGFLSCALISLIGFIFIIRNYLIFGGLSDPAPDVIWTGTQQPEIGMIRPSLTLVKALLFFLGPSLGIYFLLPKLWGVSSIFQNRYRIPATFLILWYVTWVAVFGADDPRWLMPILPFMVLVILLGLSRFVQNESTVVRFSIYSLIFRIFSSKIIFWILGVVLMGEETIRNYSPMGLSSSQFKAIPRIIPVFFDWVWNQGTQWMFLLSSRTTPSSSQAFSLAVMGVVFGLSLLWMSVKLVRPIWQYITVAFMVMVYMSTFLLLGINVPGGIRSALHVRLLDYWGQNSRIVPYLSLHANSDDVILVFGVPSGLSYYTNLKVYNLEYGGGLKILYPVYHETDIEKIYRYFKDKKIRYIVLLDRYESQAHFQNFIRQTRTMDILKSSRFTNLRMDSADGTGWKLYEVL